MPNVDVADVVEVDSLEFKNFARKTVELGRHKKAKEGITVDFIQSEQKTKLLKQLADCSMGIKEVQDKLSIKSLDQKLKLKYLKTLERLERLRDNTRMCLSA